MQAVSSARSFAPDLPRSRAFFKIEYVNRADEGAVLEFRYVTARDLDVAEVIAAVGLGAAATRGAQTYRVRDEAGLIVARGR